MTEGAGRAALRNAGLLLVQRAGLVVAGLGFAAVIPRLLGPDVYGRYALVAALAVVFAACSTLGVNEIVGRHGAILAAAPDPAGLRRLFGSLLALRLASGLLAAAAFGVLTVLWLRDLDRVALLVVALAVLARGIWLALFALFLGLNQAARWGAGELIDRWAVLALVPLGAMAAGFRGACVGLLASQIIVLAAGLWWARAFVSLRRPDRAYLSPYLRFGLAFFGSNLLGIAFQGSGEALVRGISGDYAQVSYFGVANGAFLTGVAAIQQLSLAFVAALVMLRQKGQGALIDDAARRLVIGLTAGSMAVALAALLVAPDLIPAVVGHAYGPVAANLVPMTLTLAVQSLVSGAGVLLLAQDRGREVLGGSALRLALFWTLGPLLIWSRGSLGACAAVLIATTLQAAYLGWRVRREMPGALRAWVVTVALGVPLMGLTWLRSGAGTNVALWLGACVAYLAALTLARVITREEMAATWRALGLSRRAARTP
jgi:O-antigen/teichoic acid export membrane protein